MRPQKSKRNRSKYIDNRWHGYYTEDVPCQYCLYWRGKKRVCPRPKCAYEADKKDAIKNGRIKRKKGILPWAM